jgi:hypothetical protein
VGNLVPGRIRVSVHGDHLSPQALQGNDDFLAQFTAAQQHHASGGVRKWSAYLHLLSPAALFMH